MCLQEWKRHEWGSEVKKCTPRGEPRFRATTCKLSEVQKNVQEEHLRHIWAKAKNTRYPSVYRALTESPNFQPQTFPSVHQAITQDVLESGVPPFQTSVRQIKQKGLGRPVRHRHAQWDMPQGQQQTQDCLFLTPQLSSLQAFTSTTFGHTNKWKVTAILFALIPLL